MRVGYIAGAILLAAMLPAQPSGSETSYNVRPETGYNPPAESQYGGMVEWHAPETYYQPRGLVTRSKIGLISLRPDSSAYRDFATALQATALRLTTAPLNMAPVSAGAPQDQLLALQRAGVTHFIVDMPRVESGVHFLGALRAVSIPFAVITEEAAPEVTVSQVVFQPWPVATLASELARDAEGGELTVAWIGLGALGKEHVEGTVAALKTAGVTSTSWSAGGEQEADWIVVLGDPAGAPFFGPEYLRKQKLEHKGAKLAVLTQSGVFGSLVTDGTIDLLVQSDWEKAFVAAAKLVDQKEPHPPFVVDPIVSRPAAKDAETP
ncbi:hypothetical protein GC173_12525 [bacterium]|nr:hypothetical protein [bacterium]